MSKLPYLALVQERKDNPPVFRVVIRRALRLLHQVERDLRRAVVLADPLEQVLQTPRERGRPHISPTISPR